MPKRALVFAGQGAQAPGMGKDLAEAFPECRALFEKADAVLGYSISKICFEGPAEELTKSDRAQPGIFVTSAACFEAARVATGGFDFVATAGLSLGEWTALYVAGALSFEDTLRVLEARGRLMQKACEQNAGGMVSVMGLTLDKLQSIAAAAGVGVANINSPDQIVLSGPKDKIAEAERLCKEAGAKRTIVLQVAGAFHSPLMAPAAQGLGPILAGVAFKAPVRPVYSNVSGKAHGGPAEMRPAMVAQVTGSVRWVDCIENLKAEGVTEFVEFGPGKVLSGLVRRIDKGLNVYNIENKATLDAAVAALKG